VRALSKTGLSALRGFPNRLATFPAIAQSFGGGVLRYRLPCLTPPHSLERDGLALALMAESQRGRDDLLLPDTLSLERALVAGDSLRARYRKMLMPPILSGGGIVGDTPRNGVAAGDGPPPPLPRRAHGIATGATMPSDGRVPK